jgi:hypothetical protein
MQQSQGGLRKGVETWWPLPSIIDKEVECISLGNSADRNLITVPLLSDDVAMSRNPTFPQDLTYIGNCTTPYVAA